MHISVYAIYILACLMAIGAAILSGEVLVDTFRGQQRESEVAQLRTADGQVTAMQSMIQTQMTRIQSTADAAGRQILFQLADEPATALRAENIIGAMNRSIFANWVPQLRAPDAVYAMTASFMFQNQTSGMWYDRTLQAWWDLSLAGDYLYMYALTDPEDGLSYACQVEWPTYARPQLAAEPMFAFSMDVAVGDGKYLLDSFFGAALPWTTGDGNCYWFFAFFRSFTHNGMPLSTTTCDVGLNWLKLMQSVLTPAANFATFDSQGYVLAATAPAEVQRLASCRGGSGGGAVRLVDCITSPAHSHPTNEIREVYTALHTAQWDDLTANPIPPTPADIQVNGQRYLGVSATLFARNNLRVTIVWYQPWVSLRGNVAGLSALICVLTVLSTFVLTLLGVFGVLRPLMVLGAEMRKVARALKDGDSEEEAVLEPRRPNVFHEVEAIGKDFETIVVDFLGFSSANARDNKFATKDSDRPFAVLFTDIQSSTGLWGRDPAEMSRCVQAHHELVRELIRKHRLYEVKTVGDSFMATTASAHDALHFALEVQTVLYKHDWDWPGADEFYRETTQAFTTTSATKYSALWNGLRVRIGIHYGRGDVVYDEVTKGYDYYGTVVNTAARIESVAHGGQVLASWEVLAALPAPLDPAMGAVNPLGVCPLRGVAEPPELVEIKPTALQARKYPPLRLEQASDVADHLEETSDAGHPDDFGHAHTQSRTSILSTAHHRRSTIGRTDPCRTVAQVAEDFARKHATVRSGAVASEAVAQYFVVLYEAFEGLLKPLAAQQYAAVTKALCKSWGVQPPKAKADFLMSGMMLVSRLSRLSEPAQAAQAYHTMAALRPPHRRHTAGTQEGREACDACEPGAHLLSSPSALSFPIAPLPTSDLPSSASVVPTDLTFLIPPPPPSHLQRT
eukprot:EG_transcript_1441